MNNPLRWVDPWGLGPMDNSSGAAYTDSADGEFLAGAIADIVVTKGIAAVGAKVLGGIVSAHPVAAAVVGTAMIVGGTIASYHQVSSWGKAIKELVAPRRRTSAPPDKLRRVR